MNKRRVVRRILQAALGGVNCGGGYVGGLSAGPDQAELMAEAIVAI